jgi:hypothetical protein
MTCIGGLLKLPPAGFNLAAAGPAKIGHRDRDFQ